VSQWWLLVVLTLIALVAGLIWDFFALFPVAVWWAFMGGYYYAEHVRLRGQPARLRVLRPPDER
jgi:hypothetical protein